MLMERLGEHPAWSRYLRESFAANKPWDRIAREILRADPEDGPNRGAAFFLAKRLDHYGENPVDYPALAADVGRLFLGVDLRCAQCHDHVLHRRLQAAGLPGPARVRPERRPPGPQGARRRREADDAEAALHVGLHPEGRGDRPAPAVGRGGRDPRDQEGGRVPQAPRSEGRPARRAPLQPAGRAGRAAPRAREPGLLAEHRQPALAGDDGPRPGPPARPGPLRQPALASGAARPARRRTRRPPVRPQMAPPRAGPQPDLRAVGPDPGRPGGAAPFELPRRRREAPLGRAAPAEHAPGDGRARLRPRGEGGGSRTSTGSGRGSSRRSRTPRASRRTSSAPR